MLTLESPNPTELFQSILGPSLGQTDSQFFSYEIPSRFGPLHPGQPALITFLSDDDSIFFIVWHEVKSVDDIKRNNTILNNGLLMVIRYWHTFPKGPLVLTCA